MSAQHAILPDQAVAEFLSSTTLFRGCDKGTIDKIAPHVVATTYRKGEVICSQGSADTKLGFLYSGTIAVRRLHATTKAVLSVEQVKAGDSFNDSACILGTAITEEALADEDCVVLFVGKEVFTQLLAKVAPFAAASAKRMATKMMQAAFIASKQPAAANAPNVDLSSMGANNKPLGEGDIRFVRAQAYDVDARLLSLLPVKLIKQHRVLPLELRDRKLLLGMVDPFNIGALSEIKRMLASVDIEPAAIGLDDFNEATVRLKIESAAAGQRRVAEPVPPDSITYDLSDQERDAKAVGAIGEEVIQVATRIIAAGIERSASDIHIESDATGVRVRYRINGQLVDWDQYVSPGMSRSLCARFKILSGLDITEKRLPQDGRIGLKAGKRNIDLRISTLPSTRGEKIVMRLFEAANMMRPLDGIFFDAKALATYREALNKPYGAVIVAGPTGSGKSSTLYASLGERKRTRPDTNILTVEDPVEYRLSGITQVSVNPAIQLTFARVLRSMLRQDPDVILVGEVRDEETANIALEAGMTGHLLFTSIHANNAVGVIQRLENLGCNRALIGQSINGVIVQRLARKLCKRCTITEVPPPILLETLAQKGLINRANPIALPRATGCADCGNSGFHGRVPVLEMLFPTDEFRAQIVSGLPLAELEASGVESGSLYPFRRYAALLMAQQLISPSEALLVVA